MVYQTMETYGNPPFPEVQLWDERVGAGERTELLALEQVWGIAVELADRRLSELIGLQRLLNRAVQNNTAVLGSSEEDGKPSGRLDVLGGCETLGQAFLELTNIHHLRSISLNLSNNGVGPDECKKLAEGFLHLSQLTQVSLKLRKNPLGDHGCQSLGTAFSHLVQLTHVSLDLRCSHTRDGGCKRLAATISGLKRLTDLELDLSDNRIGDPGCAALDLRDGDIQSSVKCRTLGATLAGLKLERLRLGLTTQIGKEHFVESALQEQLGPVKELEIFVR